MRLWYISLLITCFASSCVKKLRQPEMVSFDAKPSYSVERIILQLYNYSIEPNMDRSAQELQFLSFGMMYPGRNEMHGDYKKGDLVVSSFNQKDLAGGFVTYHGSVPLIDPAKVKIVYEWEHSLVLDVGDALKDQLVFEIRELGTKKLHHQIFLSGNYRVEIAKNDHVMKHLNQSKQDVIELYAAALDPTLLATYTYFLQEGYLGWDFMETWKSYLE